MGIENVVAIIFFVMAHIVAIVSLALLISREDRYRKEVEKNKELTLENKKLQVLNLYLKKKLNFKSIHGDERDAG